MPAGSDRVSLNETRRRDALRAAIAARRAGTPRRGKLLDHQAERLLSLAIGLRPGGGTVVPQPATVRLIAQGKAPRTWNRYAGALLAWERYAAARDTPFLPACPAHFANFLAESAEGARSYSQTKQRVCAIRAISAIARLPSPAGAEDEVEVRAGVRRSRCFRRGQATPVFSHEIPAAEALPSPPRVGGRPRAWPLSVEKRGRAQTVRAAALMSGAGLRYDCLQEAQLGDAIILPDLVDLTVFGSKTDPALAGQATVLPRSTLPHEGAHALLEGTRLGLVRLAALPDGVLASLAARFRASCAERAIGAGEREFANWPDDIRALATPLYTVGLPVHCLPIFGTWLFARLDADSDLSEAVPYHQFMRMSRAALSSAGLSIARHGSHSFRRGRAGELFHGGAGEPTVAEMLRHRSIASTRPYITDATRMAGLAASMRAAAPGR